MEPHPASLTNAIHESFELSGHPDAPHAHRRATDGLPFPATATRATRPRSRRSWTTSRLIRVATTSGPFLLDTLLRQVYFNALLRLPSHYFGRVATIFRNAQITTHEFACLTELNKPGMRRMDMEEAEAHAALPFRAGFRSATEKLAKSWDAFIDSLLREWETLNIVSVLLLSAILTILQIDQAAAYSVTRYTAFLSLICALMSLLYGCMFIVRFGSMRKTSQSVRWASQWGEEASKTSVPIWWNIWVMLAMPAVWLCWAVISFVVCIMSFMWHSALRGPDPGEMLPPRTALGPCVVISFVLALGLVYLLLVVHMFHRWGHTIDRPDYESGYPREPVDGVMQRLDLRPQMTSDDGPGRSVYARFSEEAGCGSSAIRDHFPSPDVRSHPVTIPRELEERSPFSSQVGASSDLVRPKAPSPALSTGVTAVDVERIKENSACARPSDKSAGNATATPIHGSHPRPGDEKRPQANTPVHVPRKQNDHGTFGPARRPTRVWPRKTSKTKPTTRRGRRPASRSERLPVAFAQGSTFPLRTDAS